MTRYRIVGSVVVAAIVAMITWSARRSEPRPPDRGDGDQTRRELVALRSELDDLRSLGLAHAAVDREPMRSVPSEGADRAPPGEPSAAPPEHEPHGGKQRMPQPAELAAQIDDKFAAEDPDPAWSMDAIRRTTEALSSTLLPGTTLGHIECRADLCRVESFHTSLDAFRSFVDVSFMSHDRKIWNGAFTSIVTETSSSGVKALSFIAREGASIPAMEPIDG